MSERIIPVPEVVVLGGRELTVSALTDRQHVELDRWVGGQIIKAAAMSLPDDDPMWERVVALAMKESVTATWSRSGALRTKYGYARLIWEMSRIRTAPSPTEDEIRLLLRQATVAEQKLLNQVFWKQNYPVRREAAEGDANPQEPA
jgi:hypothetical protein